MIHSERYNMWIKNYYLYLAQDETIETKFKQDMSNVLLFDVKEFLFKYNFNTTKDYLNCVKETRNTLFSFVDLNKNNTLIGEFYPTSTYIADDCYIFNVTNLQLRGNKLYGDVKFDECELGKLGYYLIKNKLRHFKFNPICRFVDDKWIFENGFFIK